MATETLHLCLDVTTDRARLARSLRSIELDDESASMRDALNKIASAVVSAPEVPNGILTQYAMSEVPGSGLRVTERSTALLVTTGVDEMLRVAPDARVARVSVVAHLVVGARSKGVSRGDR
jgi:hypothetical protein